ncbi:MAG: hypothetical protein ABJC26_01180, partial [Gemmatimonadaceae bacterium]
PIEAVYASENGGADGITVSVNEQSPPSVERTASLSRDEFSEMLIGLQWMAYAAGRTGVVLL